MSAPLRPNVIISFCRVRHFQVCAVPLDTLSQLRGDISKQQSLCDHPGKFEIAAGLGFAALCGVEPFAVIAWRPEQRFWRLFVAPHFRFGDELRTSAIEGAKNFAAISDEKKSFVSFFAVAF